MTGSSVSERTTETFFVGSWDEGLVEDYVSNHRFIYDSQGSAAGVAAIYRSRYHGTVIAFYGRDLITDEQGRAFTRRRIDISYLEAP